MLDMKGYQEACDRLTLDTETLEEMIEMVENQKKKILHRPTRVALLAAAMVAALGITASAAELDWAPGAVEKDKITSPSLLFAVSSATPSAFTRTSNPSPS